MLKRIAEVAARYEILAEVYTVEIVALPAGFPYQEAPWDFDDRSIEIPNKAGSLWLHVFIEDRSSIVAYAIFAGDDDVVRCSDIHVAEGHRRKGLATSLYQMAASFFEAPIVPSRMLLNDGALFWGKRTQIP